MDIEEILETTVKEVLDKLHVEYQNVEIVQEEGANYFVNIKSDNPSLLIGYHGENIQALQHLVKVLAWKKHGQDQQFHIFLDADNYRRRQEENVISLAERKVENCRKTRRPQSLPPMSAYFRRKVHLHLMNTGFEDIETFSKGDGDRRHIVIKLKA